MTKKVLAVLPLRLESVRVPKKMLAKIGSKTLCEHSVTRVLEAFKNKPEIEVIAAVDSKKVAELLKKRFPKLSVVETDPELPSGTDRVLAAAQIHLGNSPLSSLVGILNIQGDMPFVGSKALNQIADLFLQNPGNILSNTDVVTLSEPFYRPLKNAKNSVASMEAFKAYQSMAAVKVLVDKHGFAIYFSRYPIPYSRMELKKPGAKNLSLWNLEADLHLGVYGYTPKALVEFCSQSAISLELAEGLEQLRAMWLGQKIFVLKTEPEKGSSFRGIDVKADLLWAQKNYKKFNAASNKQ